jgi:hypothetical protein
MLGVGDFALQPDLLALQVGNVDRGIAVGLRRRQLGLDVAALLVELGDALLQRLQRLLERCALGS